MLYTFKCHKCEKQEDRLVHMDEKDDQICEVCNGKMEYIPTFATAFHLKGRW